MLQSGEEMAPGMLVEMFKVLTLDVELPQESTAKSSRSNCAIRGCEDLFRLFTSSCQSKWNVTLQFCDDIIACANVILGILWVVDESRVVEGMQDLEKG